MRAFCLMILLSIVASLEAGAMEEVVKITPLQETDYSKEIIDLERYRKIEKEIIEKAEHLLRKGKFSNGEITFSALIIPFHESWVKNWTHIYYLAFKKEKLSQKLEVLTKDENSRAYKESVLLARARKVRDIGSTLLKRNNKTDELLTCIAFATREIMVEIYKEVKDSLSFDFYPEEISCNNAYKYFIDLDSMLEHLN